MTASLPAAILDVDGTLVAAVAGEEVERRLADELRERWERLFDELLPEVELERDLGSP